MNELEFSMKSAVRLLGLSCDSERTSDNVVCPACYETHGKSKLNINFRKNVFRCAKCGVNGGVIDLISLFSGKNHSEAFYLIKNELGIENKEKVHISPKKEIKEAPLADIDVRDEVYRSLLSHLTLSNTHRKALNNRTD